MRLLTRSTLISSAVLLFALLISGFYIYDQVSREVHDEIDEKLLNRKLEIMASLQSSQGAIYPISIAADFRIDSINVTAYDALQEHFEDISLYELIEKEEEPHRQLVTKFRQGDKYYSLRIQTSLLDLEDMGEVIAYSTLWVIAGLFMVAFLVNFFLQRRLWRPFYQTLDQLRVFRFDRSEPLLLPPSSVKEFDELNATVEKLTAVNRRVYEQQKEFVENASHEIQTPLAIALHQTEQLIQNPDLNSEDATALELLTQQLERLSAMNKALLLLSKIDNQQFSETVQVLVGQLIRQQLDEINFLADEKELEISLSIDDDLAVRANYYLLDILIRNVIRNAVVHSMPGGKIDIQLVNRTFRVQNSTDTLPLQTDNLFGRFVKRSDSRQSVGLGLAIVKSICDTYQFTPTIELAAGQFIFSVRF